MEELSQLELDLTLLYYTMSDQYGKVFMTPTREWVRKRLGILIGAEQIRLDQRHVDVLVHYGILPDISTILSKMREPR